MIVYIGTYTSGSASQGIYAYELDASSGALTPRFTVADVPDPSYLALSPDRRMLFSVNELDEGAVSAFAVEDDRLTFVNRVASHGAHPAHLSVHPSGRWLLVANYTGGTIAALPIRADGALGDAADVAPHAGSGPHPERQAGPHPHMIVSDPAGEYVLVPDLGVDAVVAYRLDLDSGKLIAEPQAGGKQAPAAGPRHLAFGRAVYVLNELDSTLVAHDYAAGTLRHLQSVSTLPAGFTGSSTTSAVVVSPSGHHVYASNRGHDSIAIFEIDSATGRLTPRGHTLSGGRTPRDFRIDPSGRFLLAANQNSDSLVTFRVDPDTGALEPTGHVAEVPRPVCVLFG